MKRKTLFLILFLLFITLLGCSEKFSFPSKNLKNPLSEPERSSQLTTPAPLPEKKEGFPSFTETIPEKTYEEARVVEVIDGDTIVVFLNGRREKVRLIGIDTPEVGRPYYEEATRKTTELVLGKTVRLEKDLSERDKYGRLLRYVYVGSLFVNAELVRQGYAYAYTYPPDVKYTDYFLKLQSEARENERGLWAPLEESKSSLQTKTVKYVASKRRAPFHYPWCPWAKKISPYNLQTFSSREEAIQAGHRPCKVCNP